MVSEKFTKNLTPEQHDVCVRKGTETPFTGKYYASKDVGIYQCALVQKLNTIQVPDGLVFGGQSEIM